jgi:hypothetical protein
MVASVLPAGVVGSHVVTSPRSSVRGSRQKLSEGRLAAFASGCVPSQRALRAGGYSGKVGSETGLSDPRLAADE